MIKDNILDFNKEIKKLKALQSDKYTDGNMEELLDHTIKNLDRNMKYLALIKEVLLAKKTELAFAEKIATSTNDN